MGPSKHDESAVDLAEDTERLIPRLVLARDGAKDLTEDDLRRTLSVVCRQRDAWRESVRTVRSLRSEIDADGTRERKNIAAALYTFLGFLTTRDVPTTFGAEHNAVPAMELLQAFAKKFDLNIDEPDMEGWPPKSARREASSDA